MWSKTLQLMIVTIDEMNFHPGDTMCTSIEKEKKNWKKRRRDEDETKKQSNFKTWSLDWPEKRLDERKKLRRGGLNDSGNWDTLCDRTGLRMCIICLSVCLSVMRDGTERRMSYLRLCSPCVFLSVREACVCVCCVYDCDVWVWFPLSQVYINQNINNSNKIGIGKKRESDGLRGKMMRDDFEKGLQIHARFENSCLKEKRREERSRPVISGCVSLFSFIPLLLLLHLLSITSCLYLGGCDRWFRIKKRKERLSGFIHSMASTPHDKTWIERKWMREENMNQKRR